jgi:hypothetical protein
MANKNKPLTQEQIIEATEIAREMSRKEIQELFLRNPLYRMLVGITQKKKKRRKKDGLQRKSN